MLEMLSILHGAVKGGFSEADNDYYQKHANAIYNLY